MYMLSLQNIHTISQEKSDVIIFVHLVA